MQNGTEPDWKAKLDEAEEKIAYYKRLSMENGRILLRETEKLSELIHELKKTQTALVESRRSMQDIIDFLPDATFVIDQAGDVVSWNRAM